jgi:hypothetical protein
MWEIMYQRFWPIGYFAILGAIFLPACSNTKVTECNKFAAANQEVKSFFEPHQQLSESLAKKSPKNVVEFSQLAKEYITFSLKLSQSSEKANKTISALALTDEKLKSFQTDYLALIKKNKDANDQLSVIHSEQSTITAATAQDPKFKQLGEKVEAIAQTQQSIAQDEAKLISNINTYCGVTPTKSEAKPDSNPSPTK